MGKRKVFCIAFASYGYADDLSITSYITGAQGFQVGVTGFKIDGNFLGFLEPLRWKSIRWYPFGGGLESFKCHILVLRFER